MKKSAKLTIDFHFRQMISTAASAFKKAHAFLGMVWAFLIKNVPSVHKKSPEHLEQANAALASLQWHRLGHFNVSLKGMSWWLLQDSNAN